MNIGSVLCSVYGGFQESVYMLKLIIMYAEKMNTARCNLKCKKIINLINIILFAYYTSIRLKK